MVLKTNKKDKRRNKMSEDVCPKCKGEITFSKDILRSGRKRITYFCKDPDCGWFEEMSLEEEENNDE